MKKTEIAKNEKSFGKSDTLKKCIIFNCRLFQQVSSWVSFVNFKFVHTILCCIINWVGVLMALWKACQCTKAISSVVPFYLSLEFPRAEFQTRHLPFGLDRRWSCDIIMKSNTPISFGNQVSWKKKKNATRVLLSVPDLSCQWSLWHIASTVINKG